MAIGDLLTKLTGNKGEPPSFLAIELTDEIVQAAVWKVLDGRTELVTTGTPVEWDGDEKNISELLSAADASVSSALEGLDKEPDQVIFGIESAWVESGKIEASKLALIKAICKELELKPLGFVEIISSVLRYLKMQEGTPTTAIIIQVFESEIVLSLVHLGQVTFTGVVNRGDDIVSDVEEGISAFSQTDTLPSRIILFDNMHNLDELVQNLTSYDWQNKFKFLHIPRVEALPKDVVIRGIALGGGSEVAKSIGFEINDTPVIPQETQDKEGAQEQVAPKEEEIVEPQRKDSNISPVEVLGSASDFGFTSVSAQEVKTEVKKEVIIPKKITLPKLNFRFPTFPHPQSSLTKKLLLIGLALTLVIAGYFSFAWFVPKAIVSVVVNSRELDETLKLTLSTATSVIDPATGVVPAQEIKHTVSGEETVAATGKKTIGDPASGEITLYNRTSLVKTLNKGTLVSSGNLKFTLDDSVTIASKSAGSDYVDVPGKATAKITASTIGDKSNLPAGTEFVIANFGKDTYVGKNEVALKGGTSEEIKVVGAGDVSSLQKSLIAKLSEQAKSELLSSGEPGIGIYILEKSSVIENETYNAKVGEQAETLIGNIDLSITALKYQTQDVETLVATTISKAVPPGFQRTLDPPKVEIGSVLSAEDDLIETDAKVIIYLIPILNAESLATSIRGKSVSSLIELLPATVPEYKTHSVSFSPTWLPTRFQKIPRNKNNIIIKLQTT